MIAVIAARADVNLAARVSAKLRELRRKVDTVPGVRHELEWHVMRFSGGIEGRPLSA